MKKIKLFRYCIALVTIFSFSLSSIAQNFKSIKFENISTRHGLSQSSPNCIFQDSRGILWIGTEDGLNKYDGYDFTVYKPVINNPFAITNNRINCIIEDKEGNLWMGTNGGGLNIYNRQSGSFLLFTGYDSIEFQANIINCLYLDDNDIIWVGTVNGLKKIDQKKREITSYLNNPFSLNSICNDVITCIINGKPGFLWIGTEKGLNKMNLKRESFTWYLNDPTDNKSISDNTISCFFRDESNSLWIGTANGVDLYDDSNDQFVRLKLPEFKEINGSKIYNITSINEDTDGNIWIGSFGKGLYIYYKSLDQISNLTYNHSNPYSLSNNEVLSIFRDQSGIMWVGSNGLDKYNPKKEKFILYNFDPYSSESNVYRHIHTIYEDDAGVLWIGSKSDGIHLLDRRKKISWNITSNGSGGLSSNKVRVIREHPEGTMWVGTDDNGLNKIELDEYRKPAKYTYFYHDPSVFNSLSSNTIYSLYFDDENTLWIGTDNGISRLDLSTNDIKRYIPNPNDPNSLNNNTAYYIYGDRIGEIWVATDDGLNKYVPDLDGFIHYVSDENDSTTLSSNELLTVYEDRESTLWIGTYAHGINSFDRSSEKFNRYEEISELATAVVYGILEDANRNLWLSTNDGILKFNPSNNPPITHFTIEDGLQSNEYNGGAYFQSTSGEMFFGGQYGFNSFFPKQVTVDSTPPKIILTELKVNNIKITPGEKSIIKKQISEVKELVLRSFQNNITLSFAALQYANPEGNQYKYMLEGFDKNWIDAGIHRFVSYTSLPYKSYTFRVIASNSDGQWNKKGLFLKIRIKPPFYATTGFRLLLILLVILAVYLIIRNRINRENKQKEKLQKEIEEFTQELEEAKVQLEKQKEEITIQRQEIKLREKEQQDIMWFNEGLNKFSDLMSKDKGDLKKLTRNTIKSLVDYVEAEQGGIFLYNDDDPNEPNLELIANYAYNEKRMHDRFLVGEGYVGTCFKEKNVIELDHLEKGYTSLKSGLGEEDPKYIAFIPIKMDEDVIGVIEIASFKKLKGYKISFIQKMSETLHSIISSEKFTEKMLKMVEQSKLQSEELIAQEEILKQNLEEMAESQQEAMQREDFLVKQAEEFASNEALMQEEIDKLKAENEGLKKNNSKSVKKESKK